MKCVLYYNICIYSFILVYNIYVNVCTCMYLWMISKRINDIIVATHKYYSYLEKMTNWIIKKLIMCTFQIKLLFRILYMDV